MIASLNHNGSLCPDGDTLSGVSFAIVERLIAGLPVLDLLRALIDLIGWNSSRSVICLSRCRNGARRKDLSIAAKRSTPQTLKGSHPQNRSSELRPGPPRQPAPPVV